MRVDTSLALGRRDYRLSEIHHLDGQIIGIGYDTYQQQSRAQVEVLSEAKTWTPLATEPATVHIDLSPTTPAPGGPHTPHPWVARPPAAAATSGEAREQ